MKKHKLKNIVSLALAFTVTANYAAVISAAGAEEDEKNAKYPYAVFAADDQAGISLSLDSLTLNGDGYTNGTVTNTAQAGNMNGTLSEASAEAITDESIEVFDVNKDMIFIHQKLVDTYFTEDVSSYDEDLVLSDMNNNINQPVYVVGKLSIDGNLALNSAIGAVSDITVSNGNVNSNNSVIYSKFGNIKLEGDQVSVNGLVYAPFGNVIIDCNDFNTNGLIIAQNVFINGSGANINYNESIADFVGTESETLSWSMDDFKFLADTDSDGLPDVIEKEYKTDPFIADTDGDSLPDGYEVLTLYTDPLAVDTDDNGINDNEEDFDSDGLINGDEYLCETNPFISDSDGDTLSDGDEVNKYSTDPLVIDTDQDGLDDGDEIYFNTDPNVQDTDGNGIFDGDEKRDQTFVHEAKNKDSAVTEVTVSMNGTGNLKRNMKIHSVMNLDYMCTNVVGLVGEPFSIETSSQFDKATLSFKIDQTKLGDTDFNDLIFLWHDEENHEFVELDTIYDEENSTVSVETTHFSKYMVVDKEKWFEAWAIKFNYNPHSEIPAAPVVSYNTVLAIDCSGSMSLNDPSNERKDAAEGFVNNMNSTDQAAIVLFTGSATTAQELTGDRSALNSALNRITSNGGTDFDSAITASVSILEPYAFRNQTTNRILLLSDGESNYSTSVLDSAKSKQIKIYTVGLGSSSYDRVLKDISDYTGGEFYKAYTADELVDIYKDFGISGDFDTTDTDGDGLYDAVEAAGIRLENGTIIYTDPTLKDTDGDGLEDGEEIDPNIRWKAVGDSAGYVRDREYYFVMYSDPTGGDTLNGDSDGDGLPDINDPDPSSPNNYSTVRILMNNSSDVEAIQKCLEYLGYLDMEGQDYGTFGGLTCGAVQLFQLNHHMYSEGNSFIRSGDNYYIDKNTFYAIIKEALDNGYTGFTNNISSITIYNWFKREYIPVTQPLTTFDASLNSSNPCIISSVLRESIDSNNEYNDKVNIYIYDFSPALEKMLQYGAYEFHEHHFACESVVPYMTPSSSDETYDNSIRRCDFTDEDYLWLYNKVKSDAPYDIKVKNCWNSFMNKIGLNVPFYTNSFTFAFNNKIINAEMMGNILYGFAGHAGGYSKTEIVAGGSVYSLFETHRFDNDEDSNNIKYGYDLYDNYKRDYNYVHSLMSGITNYAGAYLVTDNFAYSVAFSLQDSEYKIPEIDGVGLVSNYNVSINTVIILDETGFCTQGYDNATGFNFEKFYFVPFINNQLTKMY